MTHQPDDLDRRAAQEAAQERGQRMKVEPAYYRSTHPYSFRAGEQALIQGIVMVNGRANYVLLYADGKVDFAVVNDPDAHVVIESRAP